MDLKDKVVLITGSSRGIGAAMAQAFAQAGAKLVLNSRHAATEQVTTFTAQGVTCTAIQADVADPDQVKQMIKTIKSEFGQLDVVINNAGVTEDKLLIRMQPADFEKVLQTNLVGTFNVTSKALPLLLKQRSGCIINIASVIGLTGNIGQANYAASKAGIIGFTKSVAQEAALRQVRCNAIAPGMIDTDMTAVLDEKRQADILERIPLKRFGQPTEVAQTALFLAQNDYLTGQTIAIDGGLTMY
ncbi:3-oxoacyl-[acyl-carrier-protein] reductase [Loigolactobacillus bifermentans]|uniref:3-oxoacyl-[acyl-carrier-protein] reductase n=1 Tax=Loigolactobacillus bifermentans DSM 20003 TaxID=1423726 RepID=A0A0R1GZY4_9LACO|nr:3-oxoacyl-[acyl-carrier-protein] reductase [Loigolactobacillus bifermentans]KRK39894.1 3-ketoacyl-(acyl-carrier-protein) reductase [Loigolactobacillus bifermentans DSM 20003]QGG60442.1 3-oxoacyl-[acyl-carrier-protein] reductase [Loigolactobacillus bifermentans]